MKSQKLKTAWMRCSQYDETCILKIGELSFHADFKYLNYGVKYQ